MKKRIFILFLTIFMVLLSAFVFIGCDCVAMEKLFDKDIMYTVSFNANGGSGGMEPVQVVSRTSYTVPDSTFTAPAAGSLPADAVGNTAKYFAGWNTAADGNGRWYKMGCKVRITQDTTLYAQWGYGFRVAINKWVYFAKGNLYWDGIFKMETKQYDFRHYSGKKDDVAIINGISTITPLGTVGSFFWSKKASVAYAETYSDPDAETSDKLFAADNGAIAGWTVLSGKECVYLFNRDSGSKYGAAIVCEVHGYVILPDNWVQPEGSTFKAGYGSGWTTNEYDAVQWSAMETAGAVFLPAVGCRYDSYLSGVGTSGCYWLSSPYEWNADTACGLGFSRTWGVDSECYCCRFDGSAVRLVCEE